MEVKVVLKEGHLVFLWNEQEIYDVPAENFMDHLSQLQDKNWWTNELETDCTMIISARA